MVAMWGAAYCMGAGIAGCRHVHGLRPVSTATTLPHPPTPLDFVHCSQRLWSRERWSLWCCGYGTLPARTPSTQRLWF
jgi:hypothetical protein